MPRQTALQRQPMSRELIVGTGVALADADGLDALSMRRLAQRLGVEAMTLYHYVSSKEALVESMIAAVMGEISLPAPGTGAAWKRAIRQMALSAHHVLLRHPWAAARILSSDLTPERLRYMESILRTFREGGFTPYQTHLAYHALESHIIGFTLWLSGMALPDDLSEIVGRVMGLVDTAANPYFVEHLREHLRPPRRSDVGAYEFALDLILEGLDRMRRA
jgi:AcrR family transcriptional regulator